MHERRVVDGTRAEVSGTAAYGTGGGVEMCSHDSGEVLLVREAASDGDVGDGRAVGAQQSARLVDAQTQEKPVRREAGPCLELPAELADAQPRDRGQLGQRDRV